MTATCTICGLILTAEPDGILDSQRTNRTFGSLGAQFRKHISEQHAAKLQDVLPPEEMQGSIIQLIQIMAVTVQSSILFSYLTSEDLEFTSRVEKMREMIEKSIQQKESSPISSLLTLG